VEVPHLIYYSSRFENTWGMEWQEFRKVWVSWHWQQTLRQVGPKVQACQQRLWRQSSPEELEKI
jgi:hypothetical protein